MNPFPPKKKLRGNAPVEINDMPFGANESKAIIVLHLIAIGSLYFFIEFI